MAGIRRILHPSDFSKASAAAFANAVELAKSNRADSCCSTSSAACGDHGW